MNVPVACAVHPGLDTVTVTITVPREAHMYTVSREVGSENDPLLAVHATVTAAPSSGALLSDVLRLTTPPLSGAMLIGLTPAQFTLLKVPVISTIPLPPSSGPLASAPPASPPASPASPASQGPESAQLAASSAEQAAEAT
jgi:hypothetical protein